MPYLQGLDVKPSGACADPGRGALRHLAHAHAIAAEFRPLDGPRAIVSAAAVVPALAGMWAGQRIRQRLSVEQFRLAVFWALLLTGLYTFAAGCCDRLGPCSRASGSR